MTESKHSGSEYADTMRDVLEHAAEIDKAAGHVVVPKRPVLTRPPVIIGVVVVFAGTMFFNFGSGRRRADISPAAAEASAQVSVMIATQVVEQYREENGELPESLEDLGLEADQFEYRRDEEGYYELGNAVEGSSVRYDSRMGPASLLRDLGVPLDAPAPNGNRE